MKRYVIEAVWNDADFDAIGIEREFTRKRPAVKAWESMEQSRGAYSTDWHYQLRDTKTNSVIRPLGS